MDFMKVFDRVWHDGLLHKLAQCGVSLSSLAWICNYLSGRHITVRVGEGQSVLVMGSGGLSSSRFDDDVPEVNCT